MDRLQNNKQNQACYTVYSIIVLYLFTSVNMSMLLLDKIVIAIDGSSNH